MSLAIAPQQRFSVSSILAALAACENQAAMEIKEIRDVRLRNLEIAVRECGGQAALANRINSDAAYISQVLNRWRGRGVGTALARKIELALGKPRGWMDTQHPELWKEVDMAKAAGAPLVRRTDKSAQRAWIESELAKLDESSLAAIMGLIERLRDLEKAAARPRADDEP